MATAQGKGKNGSAQKSGDQRQRPVFSKRYWPIQIAVFEFRNGDGRLNHSVELTRSFRRDEQSAWETTPYLTVQDLLAAARLLNEAYGVIQSRLQKDFDDRRSEDSPPADDDVAPEF